MTLKRFSLRPTGLLSIGQMEHRLADLAARGWLLCGANWLFDVFERSRPARMRYRLEPSQEEKPGDPPPYEKQRLCREAGWAYIATADKLHVYASPAQADAPELHTDPAELAAAMTGYRNYYTTQAGAAGIMSALNTFFLFSHWTRQGAWSLGLAAFFLLLDLWMLCRLIFLIRSLWRLQKDLAEGRLIDHQQPYKRTLWGAWSAAFALLGAGLLLFF